MNVIAEIKNLALPSGQHVVVGGGCLAVRGLRETRDLDIVVLPALFESLINQGWSLDSAYEQRWHRRRLKRGEIEIYPDMFLNATGSFMGVEKLIHDAEMIEGIPFLSLKTLRLFKSGTDREKDVQDVALIDAFLNRADAQTLTKEA